MRIEFNVCIIEKINHALFKYPVTDKGRWINQYKKDKKSENQQSTNDENENNNENDNENCVDTTICKTRKKTNKYKQ